MTRLSPAAAPPAPHIHLVDVPQPPSGPLALPKVLRTVKEQVEAWKAEEIARRAGARRPVLASNGLSVQVDRAR